MGAAVRRSQPTKATTPSRPAASEPATSAQPAAPTRTSPHTTASEAATASRAPGMSKRATGPNVGGTKARTRTTRARPIGTLTQNTACQPIDWSSRPPINGPLKVASPATPVNTPSAWPRLDAG